MPAADAIASPCINICSLDPNQDICLGCFRYLHEIEKWNSLSDQVKVKIVDELDKRKALITMR